MISSLRAGLYVTFVLVATLLPCRAVRAETDAASRALAVQLFDEAEQLFAKERASEACPKYAESFRLDPQLGVLIFLAECYEKNGQLASAWGSFRQAEEMAAKRADARQAHAGERARALQPRLAHLVVSVPSEARLRGLEVLRDGALLTPTIFGSPAAIDSGSHVIEARAPGFLPWRTEVLVPGDGASATIAVPRLRPDPKANKITPGGSAITSQRIAAIAVGGVGLVGLGVGGFFGLSAQSAYSDSKSLCSESDVCTPRGKELRETAHSRALVSSVATGVGVAAFTTAIVLWFVAPSSRDSTASTSKPARTQAQAWVLAPSSRAWGMELSRAF